MAKQPKHPRSLHPAGRATGGLETQFEATSKWRLEKVQMANFSRVSIKYTKNLPLAQIAQAKASTYQK